jgi:hypothetical protein
MFVRETTAVGSPCASQTLYKLPDSPRRTESFCGKPSIYQLDVANFKNDQTTIIDTLRHVLVYILLQFMVNLKGPSSAIISLRYITLHIHILLRLTHKEQLTGIPIEYCAAVEVRLLRRRGIDVAILQTRLNPMVKISAGLNVFVGGSDFRDGSRTVYWGKLRFADRMPIKSYIYRSIICVGSQPQRLL